MELQVYPPWRLTPFSLLNKHFSASLKLWRHELQALAIFLSPIFIDLSKERQNTYRNGFTSSFYGTAHHLFPHFFSGSQPLIPTSALCSSLLASLFLIPPALPHSPPLNPITRDLTQRSATEAEEIEKGDPDKIKRNRLWGL